MKIAVVGATGFVGSAVCDELRSQGHAVTAVPAPRVSATSYDPDAHVDEMDRLRNVFDGHSAVVNCAGVAEAASQDAPLLYGANGVVAGLVARTVAGIPGIDRLVHVSSAAVQGRRRVLDASDDLDAFSTYARSKAWGESLAAAELPGRLVIYRPPGVHGADRQVTRAMTRLAGSAFRSVAGPAPRPSPQALIENVASAVAFLAAFSGTPPRVITHPWEGVTTWSLLEMLGQKSPHVIPERVARTLVSIVNAAGRRAPRLAATARRLEMLWFGQQQGESWLVQNGWEAPVGAEGWLALSEVHSNATETKSESHGADRADAYHLDAALVSTTVPVTLRHFYRELVGIMRREGLDVTLVSSAGPHLDAAVEETGARSHVIEMTREVTPGADLRAWLRWHRVLRARRPRVVVVGTPKAALLAMTAAAMHRVPRRVYLCGGLRLEGSSGVLRLALRWSERLAMGAATEVMVNSATLKAEVLAHRLVSSAKLRQTVPGSTHGVDAQYFSPRDPDPDLQRRYGIEPGTPVLGFVGRLTHDKGIDTLLEAGSILTSLGRRIHLLVVGPQNETDSQAYVSRLMSSGMPVSLVGPVEDVRPYYALLSALVLPSLREGFPNVVLEAAAMGVPTVTTTATGCRDSVLDGRTGLLVPPSDPAALAVAISRALDDPDELSRMGDRARAWVETEFDPERIVGGWFHAPLGATALASPNTTVSS